VRRDDRIRKLNLLSNISKSLTGSFDTENVLDNVLQEIVSGAVSVIEAASAGFLSLYDPVTRKVGIRAAVGYTEEIYEIQVDPGEGLAGKAFKTGRAIVCNSEAAVAASRDNLSERMREQYRRAAEGLPQPRRAISVPLLFRGKPIGAMTIDSLRTPYEFTQFDVDILHTLADQAAIAIENARLYTAEHTSRLALQRSLMIHESLTRLVLDGCTVDVIARRLGELLQKSVVVTDAFLNVIAGGSAKLDACALGLDSKGEAIASIEALVALCTPSQNVVAVPITGPRETLGAIVLGPSNAPLSESDRAAAGHLATAVGLAMLKERAMAEAEMNLREDVLEGLISADEREVNRRAAQLGLDPGAEYGLAVVVSRAQAPYQSDYALIRLQAVAAAHIASGGLVVEKDGSVVVLYNLTSTTVQQWSRELLALLERSCPGANPLVVVGPVCQGLSRLGPVYTEVTRSIALLLRTGAKPSLFSTEALGVYRLLLQSTDTRELLNFAERTLAPLELYDTAHGAQLVPTIRCFLECNRRIGVAAEQLNVHPHSVKYRLQRARELTGFGDEHADQWLQFELALKIRDLLIETSPIDLTLENRLSHTAVDVYDRTIKIARSRGAKESN
jgi:sugar diacid utilization regulator